MAFDRPIDADRIDNFNLFSAFVRAPLWILGGVLGSSRNDDDEIDCAIKGMDSCTLSSQQTSGYGSVSVHVVSHEAIASIHTSPSENKEEHLDQFHPIGDCSVDGHSSDHATGGSKGLKRSKKNLSWSDESGLSLVVFHDEVSASYFSSCRL
jgi:hypothetical protein